MTHWMLRVSQRTATRTSVAIAGILCQPLCEHSQALLGCCSADAEMLPANCPDTARLLHGSCPSITGMLRGRFTGASPALRRSLRRTLRGKFSGCRADMTRQLPGSCSVAARQIARIFHRQLRGNLAGMTADISPDTARLLRGLLPYIQVRGWCLTKIPAFQFQKAAHNSIRLNVLKLTHRCVNYHALTGRSETGSETKQVGSE
jgi:hypothetical protein